MDRKTDDKPLNFSLSRRQLGKGALTLVGTSIAAATPLRYALGADQIKIGLVLPYSGVYANFGEGITNGFEYALKKHGRQLGGRAVEILKGDDQLDPKVGGEVTQKLVTRDKVDFVVGTVGSNVVPVMQKICTENDTFLIIPTAASNEVTRARCHPLVFRTSHSNWQITSPAGEWLFKKGKKRVITMGMNYAAGKEEIEAFVETFKAAGGEVLDQKWPGIRELDYQAYFADVLPKQPDAIFTFFAGSNAVEFVKQYAQAGLKQRVPLYGAAYLTDSTLLAAQGAAADGVITSSHWAPTLENAANKTFVAEFKQATGKDADLNSMHGHDTLTIMALALDKVKGELKDKQAVSRAIQAVEFESPRGPFRFSKARNPVQNIYAVEANDGHLRVLGTMKANVEDPTAECKA
jgi:branched-chain amino acid transport system substrate-binding protein